MKSRICLIILCCIFFLGMNYNIAEQIGTDKIITYDANGGHFQNNETLREITYKQGKDGRYTADETTVEIPTQNGFKFDGWYTDEELRTGLVDDSTPNELQVYASWERATGISSALVTTIDAPGAKGYSGLKFDDGEGHVIMLLDRNLGATSTGTRTTAPASSYGKYYQWGNNNRIIDNSTVNINSRGGGDDDNDNLRGLLITSPNNIQERRGPCPEGYHVPSIGERNALYLRRATALNKHYKQEYDIAGYINFFTTKGYHTLKHRSSQGGYEFSEAFNIPYIQSIEGLRSSTPSYRDAYKISINSVGSVSFAYPSKRNKKMPIRCFYDSYLETSYTNEYASLKRCPSGQSSCFINQNDDNEKTSGIFYNTNITVSYTDPNGNQFDAGTITVSDGNNTITILDRDLGSRCNYRRSNSKACTKGYFYQWGNNFGFREGRAQGFDIDGDSYSIHDLHIGDATLSLEKINRDQQYGPGNRYQSNKFRATSVTMCEGKTVTDGTEYGNGVGTNCNYYDGVRKKFWTNQDTNDNYGTESQIKNLRGGGNDSQSNNRGIDDTNTAQDRQGPCPEGYHIPSAGEWAKLIEMNDSFFNYDRNEFSSYLNFSDGYLRKTLTVYPYAYGVGLLHQIRIQEGGEDYFVGPVYRSSSFDNNPLILYSKLNPQAKSITAGDVMEAKPIRCFKDEPLNLNELDKGVESDPTHQLTINYKKDSGEMILQSYSHSYLSGEYFSVTSPTLSGYTPDKTTVSGIMPNSNHYETVIYTKDPDYGDDIGGESENTYTLTINYIYNNNGTTAAPSYSGNFTGGAPYSIKSPTINGYTPDQTIVNGIMLNENKTITVTYTQNSSGGGGGGGGSSVSNNSSSNQINSDISISTSPSTLDTDEWIKLTISTDEDYRDKINFSKFQYRSSSSSSWSTISRTSSTYVSDYSSARYNGYYKMTSSDDGKAVLKNLVKFKKSGYYRIYAEDTDGNESYVQINVNYSNESSSNNRDFKISISPSLPYTNERIKLTIESNDNYNGILILSAKYKNSASSTWSNVSNTSSSYFSDYSNEWKNGYYTMKSSDYGEVTLKNLVQIEKSGYYRIYVEDIDGNESYVQINVESPENTITQDTKTTRDEYDIEELIKNLLNMTGSSSNTDSSNNTQLQNTHSSAYETNNIIESIQSTGLTQGSEIYISRSCKPYTIQYIESLNAYTSPDLKRSEYFVNKEYFKRYIDSKNVQNAECYINDRSRIQINYNDTYTGEDRITAPNGKIYFIDQQNNGYSSKQLSSAKSFSTINEMKSFIKNHNPLSKIQ